jgi:glycine/D-amino acid oxidase-like deaminating enzyme
VDSIGVDNDRVQSVRLSSGEYIDSPVFINAAGPFLKDVGNLLGVDLPVHTELHMKAAIKDAQGVVGRDAPLLIWDDAQTLPWDVDEREALAREPETRWLTETFPAGVHTDAQYPEIALRGLATMLPHMRQYFNKMPRPQLDGGYYTKTRENRPLAGPMGVKGAYVLGAVSGYGIMSACGNITNGDLPDYAAAFRLDRYQDPEYQKQLEDWDDSGQL